MDFRRSITYPVIDTELQEIKLSASSNNNKTMQEAEKLIRKAGNS